MDDMSSATTASFSSGGTSAITELAPGTDGLPMLLDTVSLSPSPQGMTTGCDTCQTSIGSTKTNVSAIITGLETIDYTVYTDYSSIYDSFLKSTSEDAYVTNNSTTLSDTLTSTAQLPLLRSLLVGLLSSLLAVAIIFGNTLIILAVYREKHLRTVTNLFIVSLACADFLIGAVVLPFAISMEITQGYWPYGRVWCDLWHAFDILGCTASILNLCVIAGDRYWAITHPISYPRRMTKKTAVLLIALAWICSSLISFPCIWWWQAVEPPQPPMECIFPSDAIYLITSSCVSFYIPSFIMVFMYLKIYRTAVGQVRALRSGTKRMKSADGSGMAMRVHKGGTLRSNEGSMQKRTSTTSNTYSPQTVPGAVQRRSSLSGKRLMSRLSREHKAARTLGIVMGVFIICWLPFFIVNVTAPVCQSCYFHPIVIGIVTWLGYVNSALNPVIYAFASRSFKRSFTRILCTTWKGTMTRNMLYDKRKNGSGVFHIDGGGVAADTSITQYSEEKNSMDSSSTAHLNLKYTLPYVYF